MDVSTTTTTEQASVPAENNDHFVLMTKLAIPPVRSDIVERPRLNGKLEIGLRGPLTLLAASAGFGKTTVLSAAIQHYQWPAAWLSLDSGDDDLTRFWLYIFAALETVHPGASKGASSLLQSPRHPPIEAILAALINNLTHLQQHIVLVLDDYHVITAKPIHASLTFLLDHLPSRLHLAVTTRVDPPLPLARLRTRGQLTEIRTADLRFTDEEAAAFLKQATGLDLSREDIQALETRTEGWIAGLQLAALSMQGRKDISSFIKAFTGNHRYIVDYLVQEVLALQPEAVQNFLLQTSILDRLNGSLCEAVTGQPNGQEMLEQLEQANLFLQPLDDERYWYRYHHLFTDLLRHRLRREQPELLPTLHQRASKWYQQHDLILDAISHALAITDFEQAASLIESVGEAFTRRGELTTLHTWLQALPAEVVQARPVLSIIQGWVFFLIGHLNEAEHFLLDMEQRYGIDAAKLEAEEEVPQVLFPLLGEIAAIRASIAIVQADGPRTIKLSQQALKYLAADNASVGLVTWYLGLAYWLAGDLVAASRTMAEAYTRSLANGNSYFAFMAMHELASLQAMQGHLHQAEQTYQQALQLARERREQAITPGPINVGMGDLQREWNNLETAAHLLEEGIEQCLSMENTRVAMQGYIALILIRHAQENTEVVQTLLQKMAQLAQSPSLPSVNQPLLSAFQARIALAQGNTVVALRWAQECGLNENSELDPLHINVYLILARVLIAQHKTDEALSWLERLLPLAEVQERLKSKMEIFILKALAHQARANSDMAIRSLEHALALAEPEGYIRLFVDEGVLMKNMLVQIRTRPIRQQQMPATRPEEIAYSLSYVDRLLSAFGEQGPQLEQAASLQPVSPLANSANVVQSLAEPLSEREREILRLIVAGHSNREIADALVLAISTVKWYVNIIYGKLQVESRTKAVARARTLGLV